MRVLFRETKATGVVTADGAVHHADDVILSAGTYGSAAILLRSGIGPAGDLTSLGIEPRADLPVGQHTIYTLAPGRTQTSPALGALLWTASSEAADGDLDLNIVAVHPNGAPFMPTGGVVALSTALVLPDAHGTLRLAGLLTPHELPADAAQLMQVIESNLAIYGHATSTAPMGTADSPHAVVDSRGAVHGFGSTHADRGPSRELSESAARGLIEGVAGEFPPSRRCTASASTEWT